MKIVVAGGFGVGKTTLVASCSEIMPVLTEEVLTHAGIDTDNLAGVEVKDATTVVMDFGRITISPEVVLYLFGTPGQNRFWFLWDELTAGALGAVVVVDTRRLGDSFASIDYFERRATPFVVAVNCFDGEVQHTPEQVRKALDLERRIPVVLFDARDARSSRQVIIDLVEHVRHAPRPS